MRQGQQNRRGRGRNNSSGSGGGNNHNSNRKSQNPLTRSFESSGPDVKVRGTPSHIAEKYISLARDALSSGDPVLAESYLQHAEHYNRIILTYREQQMSQGGEYQGALPRAQTFNAQDPMDGEDFDDEGDDQGGNVQPQAAQGEGQPQGGGMPHQQRQFDGPPRYDNRPQRHDNNRGDNRPNNNYQRNDGNRYDRNDRGDNQRNDNRGENRGFNRNDNRPDRNGPDRAGADRSGGEPRDFRDDRGPPPAFVGEALGAGEGFNGNGNSHRRRERFQGNANAGNIDRQPPPFAAQPPPMPPVQAAPVLPPLETEQPAFLRRPVRRPRRDDAEAAPAPRAPVSDEQE
jgi:Domain of unknown function (DUF4167)